MKKIKKVVSLLEHGINKKLLSSLNESQIDSLYNRLIESKKESKEAVTTKSSIESTKYTGTEVASMKSKGQGLKVNGEVLPTADGGLEVIKRTGTSGAETTESEMNEDDNINLYSDPDASADGMGMFEEELDEKFESKSQQKYFYARCNDKSLSKEKRNKWCKMADEFSKDTNYSKLPEKKKETKESYLNMIGKAFNKNMSNKVNDMNLGVKYPQNESELEKKIISLIEKHISPKMTKKELLGLLEQGAPTIAPPKPKTPKTSPDTPYKPRPGIKPAPKAKKETNEQGAPTIAPPKPKTPKIKPSTPYQPRPGIKPAPKAEEIPSWLSFESIGLNIK